MKGGYNAKKVDLQNRREEFYKNKYKKITKFESKNGVQIIKFENVEKEVNNDI